MTGKILSYSAGSTSLDPYKFRVIDSGKPAEKMNQLVKLFPELTRFFLDPSRSLVVDAYPASLGGMESMTRVITYLHPPTCIRALRLAASEKLRAVFIAQPLAGADLLLRALDTEMDWPEEMLWATGGYPLPASLQHNLEVWLADRGCRLSVLQAYGVAELDHTLLAAMDRDEQFRPIYQLVDHEFELETDHLVTDPDSNSRVRYRGMQLTNDDRIQKLDTGYRILGNPSVYAEGVLDWLEQWDPVDWENFTGYFFCSEDSVFLQRRDRRSANLPIPATLRLSVSSAAQRTLPQQLLCKPINHHEFMSRRGMSWMEKPKWNAESFKQLDESTTLLSTKAAAA